MLSNRWWRYDLVEDVVPVPDVTTIAFPAWYVLALSSTGAHQDALYFLPSQPCLVEWIAFTRRAELNTTRKTTPSKLRQHGSVLDSNLSLLALQMIPLIYRASIP